MQSPSPHPRWRTKPRRAASPSDSYGARPPPASPAIAHRQLPPTQIQSTPRLASPSARSHSASSPARPCLKRLGLSRLVPSSPPSHFLLFSLDAAAYTNPPHSSASSRSRP